MPLDAYTHIFPQKYCDALIARSTGLGNAAARLKGVPSLTNLEARFREMDVIDGYSQVIASPHPVLEEIATRENAAELARICNDEMAELVRRYPDRFPAFVATVSLLDVDSAVAEIRRAVTELGARGVQIYTNIVGRPLDLPEFEPVFAIMAELNLPIWLHPARTAAMTDYKSEAKSRYEMWWCFGWPYETSVAMSRLVYAGVLDRYPNLRIITHHLGGMIPFFDGRVGPGMEFLGSRTADEDYSGVLRSLKKPHLDYFRMFYADTALFGGTAGLPSGLKFFGAEHVLFATDMPFGPILPTYAALDTVDLDAGDREKILGGNIKALLRL
ncbi:MAG: amidohydrolase [Mesorhizobium sp.]|nr:MAG: amidohydrolase [Mesorhizobium sp.]